MEMRALGTTGVRVSPLCLGAMMFGSWGNPDHEESVQIVPPGINLNPADGGYLPPSLADPRLRRR
jgi:hypothetical protein